ncbi:MAG: UvrD-helicase domain-containing protein [Deltaproteobacteria bacterium]|nr:UvrD-helicase domain-containing protein [Deltaproteobacteria bacterium]
MSDRIDYEKVLNPAQLKAVMTLEGPVLVIAGAGSGKTRTLVYRVARLVETGVPPESILLLTFTRKAAGEMLERAAGLADERCTRVSGGTFHSLAHRVLRQNASVLGFHSSFTVLDRADMEEVIQSLVKENQIDKDSVRFPKRGTLANILSKSANLQQSIEALMIEEYAQFVECVPHMKRLSEAYVEHKKKNQLMDYDDLIILFRQLLSENEEIRRQLNEQYQYVMVDEYQDTNAIQADIVKWLASRHRNIMVVGDDSQSIYSFRGANYKNMFDFPVLFPETRVVKLEENYRSTQPILTFTNALMAQAQEKYTKCLFTERTHGEIPRVVDTRSEPEQALFICRFVKEQMKEGRSIKDFAVLFRAAHHSFELEMELTRQGIPYVKYGGFKFMESAHIKDVLAHLRVIMNRNDTVSWGRILRLVKGVGQVKSQSIIEWLQSNKSLGQDISEWPGTKRKDKGLKSLSKVLTRISEKGVSPRQAIESAIQYYEPILKERFDDFPKRQKDLEQLITMAGRYKRLRTFVDDLILEPPTSSADIDPEERGDTLTLSTVHSAKGLEWSVVFIIWAMEGYFPSTKAYSNQEGIEEERRLMYVAATRAKDRILICYPSAESRPAWQWGDVGYRSGLSSFVRALPNDVVDYGSSISSRGSTVVHRVAPEPVKYRAARTHSSELRPGDRVAHPAFGRGVVSKLIDDEKVEVLFRDWGRKLLHLGYTSLEKI